jgi:hypothetical protein
VAALREIIAGARQAPKRLARAPWASRFNNASRGLVRIASNHRAAGDDSIESLQLPIREVGLPETDTARSRISGRLQARVALLGHLTRLGALGQGSVR